MTARLLLAACTLALGTGNAAASGGISCSVEDDAVTLSLDGGVTHGMGGGLFDFAGTVELKGSDVPADLRRTEFAREHVAQYWYGDGELRLLLYREREGDKPHGYVQVTVRTAIQDETEAAGTFEVTTWDTSGDGDPKQTRSEGPVTCFVE